MRRLFLLLALLGTALWAGARPMGIIPSDEERQTVMAGHELEVARTLATLNLTPGQRLALLPILHESVKEITDLRAGKAKAQGDFMVAMTALRTAVLANKGVSEAVKTAASRAETQYTDRKKHMSKPIRGGRPRVGDIDDFTGCATATPGACLFRLGKR